MNILDSLKGLVTDELVSKAAGALGEDGGAISKVMQGAIPSVLGGLMGSNEKNHGDLAGLFGQAAGNDNLMGDILGGLSGGGNNAGGGIMDSLIGGIFGDKASGIVNILTNLGGLKNGGSSKSILGMVGSLAASYFGKKMMKDGLGFGSILNMIGGEKDAIMAAAPEGVMDAIGVKPGPWQAVKDIVGNVTGAVTGTAGKVVDGAGNAVKGAAGAVTGAAGAAVDGAGKAAGAVVDGAGKAVGAAGGAVKGAAGAVTGAAGSVVSGAGDLAGGAVDGAKKGMKWLWPLLLLAALAVGLFWVLGKAGCNNAATDMANDVTTSASSAVGDVADGVGDAAGAVADGVGDAAGSVAAAAGELVDGNWVVTKGEAVSLKMEDGTEVATTKGSVIDKLYNFAKDPDAVADKTKAENWFNFEDCQFETGSATLKASAMNQIKNAATILNSFPNVKIKIGGYTDNTGNADANMTLSNKRAESVYNAIINQGATAASFDEKPFEGYGIEHPIGDNSTDAGRAQNRRIACVVTAK
jgi:outer membrane protein OmpA-like peptidoglycan-associated protein